MAEQAAVAEPFVLSTRDAGVETIMLNRGGRFNPLSSDMIAGAMSPFVWQWTIRVA